MKRCGICILYMYILYLILNDSWNKVYRHTLVLSSEHTMEISTTHSFDFVWQKFDDVRAHIPEISSRKHLKVAKKKKWKRKNVKSVRGILKNPFNLFKLVLCSQDTVIYFEFSLMAAFSLNWPGTWDALYPCQINSPDTYSSKFSLIFGQHNH